MILTHYVIVSYNAQDCNPQSWVLEASLDGEPWMEMDRRVNASDLRVHRATRQFQIANRYECRFIRFRQIDQNHAMNNYLYMTSFEVFGSLIETHEK